MPGHVDEVISSTFVVDGETLRDLDALIRQHCNDIDGAAEVNYAVHRVDGFEYSTKEIEDILRERNGAQTRIDSIRLEVQKSKVLKFSAEFADWLAIKGSCEDRAKLLTLVTDVRALVRDRIIRGKRWDRSTIIKWVAAVCFVIAYFGFQTFQNTYVNQVNADNQATYSRLLAPYTKEIASSIPSPQTLISQAKKAVEQGNLRAEIGFLIQQQIQQLQSEAIGQQEQKATTSSSTITVPWWASSWWAAVAAAGLFSLASIFRAYEAVA